MQHLSKRAGKKPRKQEEAMRTGAIQQTEVSKASAAQDQCVAPEVAMANALSLQHSMNDEDLEWLSGRQDLDKNTREEVFARIVARGGLFLEFIEKLVGFSGGYDRLPEPSEVGELGRPATRS